MAAVGDKGVMENDDFVCEGLEMSNRSRAVIVLMLGFVFCCGLYGCKTRRKTVEQPVWRLETEWLVPQEALKEVGLERVWQSKLPIRRTEKLERLELFGDKLYGLTDQNFMVCLDTAGGNVLFSKTIGAAGLPVVGLDTYEDELFSVIGGELVELDARSGQQLSSVRLGYDVSCPAGRNGPFFYVGAVDRRIHALRSEDKVQVFEASAQNESMVTAIIADEKFVVFATDRGNCISIAPQRPRLIWKFKAEDAIIAPIVRDKGAVYFACEDTNIYKLNIRTGQFVWKYKAGGMLDRGPRLGRSLLYQYVRGKGLVAVDAFNGKPMWQLAEGVELLTESGDRAYIITENGNLVVMDNKKEKKIQTLRLRGISRYAANTADSKIYIAADDGRIACLRRSR